MKYRVKFENCQAYPYKIYRKRKTWHSWTQVSMTTSLKQAEEWIKDDVADIKPDFGTIVFTYDELDQVVDKLKG